MFFWMNVRYSQNYLGPLQQPLVRLMAGLCQPCRESGPLNSWPQGTASYRIAGRQIHTSEESQALGKQHKAGLSAPVFLPFLLLYPGTKSASPF